MQYKKLVETYEKLDSTSKRLEKTYYVSELLKSTKEDNLHMITLLLQGKVFPNTEDRKIGVSSKLIVKALNIATGISLDKIENLWAKTGDLGNTAQELCSKKTQRTLFQQKLTVSKVFNNLQKLVEFEGEGTVDKKVKLISELLTSAEPIEAKFIARTVLEDLRLGVGNGVMRDAIVWSYFPKVYGMFFKCERCDNIMPNVKLCLYCANDLKNKFDEEKVNFTDIDHLPESDFVFTKSESDARKLYNELLDLVQKSYDLLNDFGEVSIIAKTKGVKGLKNIKLEPLKPLKLMLFLKENSFEEAFERVGKPCAIEYKYDGFRIQAHKKNDVIKLFTRSSEDVTKQFPDVVEEIENNVKAKEFIVDGEVLGITEKGKFLPFQHISQRIRRKHNIHELVKKLPVVLKIFDIMELDGESFLDREFKKRHDTLKKIVKKTKHLTLAEQEIVSDVKSAEKFYEISLQKGNEGVMMKSLRAPYKPGKRVGHGIKIKPSMETLDLVITGAEKGEGKRSEWFSSFVIACRDDDGNFLEIGKVGTGFKEKSEEGLSFEELTKLLKPSIISEKGKIVKVSPKIVLEVEFEEIQKSPSYSSGFALRFPRVKMIREDKPVDEIANLEMVRENYNQQKKV